MLTFTDNFYCAIDALDPFPNFVRLGIFRTLVLTFLAAFLLIPVAQEAR